jgi:hypothetical protein
MEFGMSSIVLGLVGCGLSTLVVIALMRIAGEGDRQARHAQRRIDPFQTLPLREVLSGNVAPPSQSHSLVEPTSR